MNPKILNLKAKTHANTIFDLKAYEFDYQHSKFDTLNHQIREIYNHGDGASVLLYNKEKRSVVLTQQFRLATYLNQNPSGNLIEVCAGSLDGDTPEFCAKKEVLEETGYQIDALEKVMQVYASPAVMTEIAHLFIAPYTDNQKITAGGGLHGEGEYLSVIELPFATAFAMLATGQIQDARTAILLQHLKINQFSE